MQVWDLAPVHTNGNASALAQLMSAATFAAVKHKDQRRKDAADTPYINHTLGVAQLLAQNGYDDLTTLQAALLHDTVEDTATTFDELAHLFGAEVAQIVRECTDDKSQPKGVRKQTQIDKAGDVSVKAKRVKLADKLYNLRDLQRGPPPTWTVARIKEYYRWARAVTAQMEDASPALTGLLGEVYAHGTFERDGVVYNCMD